MKIAHIGLACHFTYGMTYQDNMLTDRNVKDGHQVLYVSDAQRFENGKIVVCGYEDTVLPNGVRLVRMPYERFINGLGTEKFRRVKGLYDLLCDFAPDVILCHDLCYWSVLDVIRYRKEHKNVRLYSDNHADYGNSGTNWVSLHILHGIYYKALFKKALPYVEKILCTSVERRDFVVEVYGCPEEKTEFYPLGGTVYPEEDYLTMRRKRRSELQIDDETKLFVHSGKLDEGKETAKLLDAFYSVPELNARLIIIGSVPEDMKEKLLPRFERDKRVEYLGWKKADELTEYLCAGDMYLQPGTISATMENAMCCRCAQMLKPVRSYTEAYPKDMAVWVENEEDMENAFRALARGEIPIDEMRKSAYNYAYEILDYRKLAARLYR